MLTKACSQRLVVHLLFIWRSNNKTHLWHCASASSWAVNAISIFLRTQTEPLLNPKHPEKTKARIAIYSAGEIWGFEAARAVLIHIIAERWRHAPTKVTPQVLKSSIAVFFPSPSCLSFISSPPVLVCIHLPCLFICTVSLLITSSFHLLSNDLWDQFDPQTNSLLLPSRRPVSLALFLIVSRFLSFFFLLLSLILMLIWRPVSPSVVSLLLLLSCLFLLFWPFYPLPLPFPFPTPPASLSLTLLLFCVALFIVWVSTLLSPLSDFNFFLLSSEVTEKPQQLCVSSMQMLVFFLPKFKVWKCLFNIIVWVVVYDAVLIVSLFFQRPSAHFCGLWFSPSFSAFKCQNYFFTSYLSFPFVPLPRIVFCH